MPGLDPGIHLSMDAEHVTMDGRIKSGHDAERVDRPPTE
jgi:hypothetical protein